MAKSKCEYLRRIRTIAPGCWADFGDYDQNKSRKISNRVQTAKKSEPSMNGLRIVFKDCDGGGKKIIVVRLPTKAAPAYGCGGL